jgi:hypothetical protein
MLYDYLYEKFKSRFEKIYKGKDKSYLFVNNKARILVVAHLDVAYAWNRYGNSEVYMVDNKYLWSPLGIGGDDRAGVQVLYWLSKSEYKNKVNYLFTRGEERGCIGARAFNIDWKDKLDLYAMIEFDREGNDFVMYRYKDKDWEEYIAKITKRKAGIGSISDISYLDMGVRGVNLGIGYYHNHMGSAEFVVIDLIKRAYADGVALINDIINKGKKWEYKEIYYPKTIWDDYDNGFRWPTYRNKSKDFDIDNYDWYVLRFKGECMCKSYSDLFTSEKDGISRCINCIVEKYDIIYFNYYETKGYADGECCLCGYKGKVYIDTKDMIIHCESCIRDLEYDLSRYVKINRIRVKLKGTEKWSENFIL